ITHPAHLATCSMDPATPELYTLSLHDALPILRGRASAGPAALVLTRPNVGWKTAKPFPRVTNKRHDWWKRPAVVFHSTTAWAPTTGAVPRGSMGTMNVGWKTAKPFPRVTNKRHDWWKRPAVVFHSTTAWAPTTGAVPRGSMGTINVGWKTAKPFPRVTNRRHGWWKRPAVVFHPTT